MLPITSAEVSALSMAVGGISRWPAGTAETGTRGNRERVE
jgi:hypothetical protein